MKKMIAMMLVLTMMAVVMMGCGAEKPQETTVPETSEITETPATEQTQNDSMMDDGEVEMTELEKFIEDIYANHAEMEIIPMTMVQDLTDLDALKYNTGLESADKLADLAVSEAMGSMAYSLVIAKVNDAADAEAVAQEMFDNIDQRKWICVEADTKVAAYAGDTVMLFMAASDLADMVSTDSMVEAFKTTVGSDITVIE